MSQRKPSENDKPATNRKRRPSLDEVWPVHSAGHWPAGLSLDRGDIYESRT